MIKIHKLDSTVDNRYCSSCGSTKDVYELLSTFSTEVRKLEKSFTLCKHCLSEVQGVTLDSLHGDDSVVVGLNIDER